MNALSAYASRPDRLRPLDPIPISELSDMPQLATNLQRLIKCEFPAFIVRKRVAQMNALVLREKAIEELSDLGYECTRKTATDNVSSKPTVGKGPFHTDKSIKASRKDVIVHTTSQGAGEVLFGNAGDAGNDASQVTKFALARSTLEELIEHGYTDIKYMQPRIYVGHLAAGDSVVFMQANKFGPVWHRFDTSQAERKASIAEFSYS